MSDNRESNIHEAKKSLKHQIKFFENLLAFIRKGDEPNLSKSMWATWCIHRYIEDRLVFDIEKAMKEHGGSNENN